MPATKVASQCIPLPFLLLPVLDLSPFRLKKLYPSDEDAEGSGSDEGEADQSWLKRSDDLSPFRLKRAALYPDDEDPDIAEKVWNSFEVNKKKTKALLLQP